MKRIEMACFSLAASAFVLAGILMVQLGSLSSQAKANMVIDRETFAVMTARTSNNDESLFIVDNSTGELLIYNMNLARHRLDLGGSVNLNLAFGVGGPTSNQGGGVGGQSQSGRPGR